MDFPLFYLDSIGNRLLMAVIATVHVMINHPFAVGAYPLVALIEWWGRRTKSPEWDRLAYRVTFVLFIVTTTVGALTGVGIWFTAGLIAPFGIGSLLRVFFWAWFSEWLVFVAEVVLLMLYFLMWRHWADGWLKKLHLGVGVVLSVCSLLTMVIVVAILSFMMGTGSWNQTQSFFSAFFNPLYLPQLAFRTPYAMLGAGLLVWFLLFFFTRRGTEFRDRAVRFVALWTLFWTPFSVAGAAWYLSAVPIAMKANLGVGLLTQAYEQWQATFLIVVGLAALVMVAVAAAAAVRPRLISQVVLLLPLVLGLYLLGHFERAREFVRKPHVVADYMYSNGVTMEELPVFQRDGILRYATYTAHKTVTPETRVGAGQDVFMIACSRCHTTGGVNSVVTRFRKLYGDGPWDNDALLAFVQSMHISRTFMPPFPGNDAEAEALVAFVNDLRATGRTVSGAQTTGLPPAAPNP